MGDTRGVLEKLAGSGIPGAITGAGTGTVLGGAAGGALMGLPGASVGAAFGGVQGARAGYAIGKRDPQELGTAAGFGLGGAAGLAAGTYAGNTALGGIMGAGVGAAAGRGIQKLIQKRRGQEPPQEAAPQEAPPQEAPPQEAPPQEAPQLTEEQFMQLIQQLQAQQEAPKTAGVIAKMATRITREDIRNGLAGRGPNENIQDSDVDSYGQAAYDKKYEAGRNNAGIGAALGGGLGAMAGGALGSSVGGGGGAALGAGIGAAGGAGLGALIGKANRSSGADTQEAKYRYYASLAQQGGLPGGQEYYPSDDALISRAQGEQEDLKREVSPEEYQQLISDLRRQAMSRGALEGTLGAMQGQRQADMYDDSEYYGPGALEGGATGALQGYQEGGDSANTVTDLRERGYGYLGDKIMRSRLSG